MKLFARVTIEGNIVLPPGATSIAVEWDDVSLSVTPQEKRGVLDVKATRTVPIERIPECIGRINRTPGKADEVYVRYPVDIIADLLTCLHKFESHLTFLSPSTHVSRLNWEEHTVGFMTETREEAEAITVTEIGIKPQRPNQQLLLTPRLIDKIGTRIRLSGDIYLTMAFFREGNAEFLTGRFASAFCNFYFVVEDMFGGERTFREEDVVASFRSNKMAMRVFAAAFEALQKHKMGKHRLRILAHFKETNTQIDPIGVGRMMVRMRNRLRHFSRKRLASAGTPFNDAGFEGLAFLGLHVAHLALLFHFVEEDRARAGLPPEE